MAAHRYLGWWVSPEESKSTSTPTASPPLQRHARAMRSCVVVRTLELRASCGKPSSSNPYHYQIRELKLDPSGTPASSVSSKQSTAWKCLLKMQGPRKSGFNCFHLFFTPVTHHHNTGGSSGDAKISLPLSTHTRRLERIDTRPHFWITVHLTNAHHSGLSYREYGRLRHYRQP